MRKRFLSLWFPYLGIEHIFRSKSDFNKASYATVTKNNNLFFIHLEKIIESTPKKFENAKDYNQKIE